MTLGTGFFTPNGQFNVQRSYLTAVAFDAIFFPNLGTPPHFVFEPASEPGNFYHVTLLPQFYVYTTNSYTLDHIVTESWATFGADPTHYAYNFRLKYLPPSATTPPAIHFLPQFYTSTPVFLSLPPRDQPYWLPDL